MNSAARTTCPVLLVIVMAAGFVLWYSDTGDGQAVRRYEIYFDGSVSGLSEGSTVRYLGVAVGRDGWK